jgi:hypothetical protein
VRERQYRDTVIGKLPQAALGNCIESALHADNVLTYHPVPDIV